jgi:hypothetical protein
MHGQVSVMRRKILSLRARFAHNHGGTEREISFERRLTAEHEREHIRGVIFAAICTIEFTAFFQTDDPQRDAGVGTKRGAYPLAKLARCWNAAGCCRILNGEA